MKIRHKGLRRLHRAGSARGVSPAMARRLTRRLDMLAQAVAPADMDLPGWRLRPLTSDRAGYWSVRVQRNWRLTFRFADGEAVDVDLTDYH